MHALGMNVCTLMADEEPRPYLSGTQALRYSSSRPIQQIGKQSLLLRDWVGHKFAKMPTFRGISVNVLKPSGEAFTEYDVRNLRSSGPTSPVTSKIMCEDNQRFAIKFSSTSWATAVQNVPNVSGRHGYNLRSSKTQKADSGNAKSVLWDDEGRARLLFEVYIDGNETPECSFAASVGSSLVEDGRWSTDADDRLFTKAWKFSSAPLEHLFAQGMEIKRDDYEIPTGSSDRDLIEVVTKMGGDLLGPTRSTRGIEVKVTRVYTRTSNKPSRVKYAGDLLNSHGSFNESVADVTHVVGASDERTPITSKTKSFRRVDQHRQAYVTFRFQYMAKHKLFQLGLCGEDGTPTAGKGRSKHQVEPSVIPALPLETLKRDLDSGLLGSGPSKTRRLQGSSDVECDTDDRDSVAADGPRKDRTVVDQFSQLKLSSPDRQPSLMEEEKNKA